MRRASWLLAAIVFAAAAGGCLTFTQRREDTLIRVSREMNDNLRWGRYQQVAEHLPPDERRAMLERVADMGDDMSFADSEVSSIDFAQGSAKATVLVQLSWYQRSNPVVRATTVEQTWEHKERGWVLTKQRRARGDRFPLVPEPAPPHPDPPPSPLPAKRTQGT